VLFRSFPLSTKRATSCGWSTRFTRRRCRHSRSSWPTPAPPIARPSSRLRPAAPWSRAACPPWAATQEPPYRPARSSCSSTPTWCPGPPSWRNRWRSSRPRATPSRRRSSSRSSPAPPTSSWPTPWACTCRRRAPSHRTRWGHAFSCAARPTSRWAASTRRSCSPRTTTTCGVSHRSGSSAS